MKLLCEKSQGNYRSKYCSFRVKSDFSRRGKNKKAKGYRVGMSELLSENSGKINSGSLWSLPEKRNEPQLSN